MPAKTQMSSLAAKYGNRLDKAVQKHAKDETKYGIIKIPSGINNGIAKVKECYFSEYKTGKYQGKPYLRAMAVVVEPRIHTGVPIAGLQTSIMVECHIEGDENHDDAWEKAENSLRAIGGEKATFNVKTVGDLEVIAAAIQKAGPYIRFSTSDRIAQEDYGTTVKKGDITGVWENWHGSKGLENYQPTTRGAFNDKSPSTNGVATKPISQPETPVEYRDDMDLDSLYKRVSKDDGSDDYTQAAKHLEDLCSKNGMSDEEFSAANWDEVLAFLKGDGGESGGSTEPDEKTPTKGDVVGYFPPDTKKKGKFLSKKSQCEVTFVDSGESTVTLRDNSTKKVYKSVPWDQCVDVD